MLVAVRSAPAAEWAGWADPLLIFVGCGVSSPRALILTRLWARTPCPVQIPAPSMSSRWVRSHPYCRFKVMIRASLPVRNLTVRRNARRCSRAWRELPAPRLVAADENTVRDVIHAFNERGLAALAPRWAGGRPRRISERGHAEGEPTR